MLSEKTIHKTGRIDQVVRDYFATHSSVSEIMAKELMPLFIKKGIFLKDYREGLPIRKLLRRLAVEEKLYLLKHLKVVRKPVNRNWYFINYSLPTSS